MKAQSKLKISPDKLLILMQGLLEESKQAQSINEIERIEQVANSILSNAIKEMKNSNCDAKIVQKLIDIHGQIIL